MTARIGLSFHLCAPRMNAHTWITFISWGRSCAVVMRPRWRYGGRRSIGELTYFWLVFRGRSAPRARRLRHVRAGRALPAHAWSAVQRPSVRSLPHSCRGPAGVRRYWIL